MKKILISLTLWGLGLALPLSAFAVTEAFHVFSYLPCSSKLVSYSGDFAEQPPATIRRYSKVDLMGTFYFFKKPHYTAAYRYAFINSVSGKEDSGTCKISFDILPVFKSIDHVSGRCTGPINLSLHGGVYPSAEIGYPGIRGQNDLSTCS